MKEEFVFENWRKIMIKTRQTVVKLKFEKNKNNNNKNAFFWSKAKN